MRRGKKGHPSVFGERLATMLHRYALPCVLQKRPREDDDYVAMRSRHGGGGGALVPAGCSAYLLIAARTRLVKRSRSRSLGTTLGREVEQSAILPSLGHGDGGEGEINEWR